MATMGIRSTMVYVRMKLHHTQLKKNKGSTMGKGFTMGKGSTMGMESTMGMGFTIGMGSTMAYKFCAKAGNQNMKKSSEEPDEKKFTYRPLCSMPVKTGLIFLDCPNLQCQYGPRVRWLS